MFLVIKKKYSFPNALIVCKFIKCMTSFTPIGDSSWSSYFSCCWIDLNKIIARVPECVENPRGHRVYHTYNIIVTLTNQNNVHVYNHIYIPPRKTIHRTIRCMAHYTLTKFLKSVEHYLILKDSMMFKKYIIILGQIGNKYGILNLKIDLKFQKCNSV